MWILYDRQWSQCAVLDLHFLGTLNWSCITNMWLVDVNAGHRGRGTVTEPHVPSTQSKRSVDHPCPISLTRLNDKPDWAENSDSDLLNLLRCIMVRMIDYKLICIIQSIEFITSQKLANSHTGWSTMEARQSTDLFLPCKLHEPDFQSEAHIQPARSFSDAACTVNLWQHAAATRDRDIVPTDLTGPYAQLSN